MIVPSRSKRKVVRVTRGIYSYVEDNDSTTADCVLASAVLHERLH